MINLKIVINIQMYSAVNKVRIPFEYWSTLRSDISLIYKGVYWVDRFLTDKIRHLPFFKPSYFLTDFEDLTAFFFFFLEINFKSVFSDL